MRILCDVDGVLADLCTQWLSYYNAQYNDHLTVEDLTEWDIHKFVKPECGTKMYDYLRLSFLYTNVKPIEGALGAVTVLREHNYDVLFVTSGVQPGKVEWLYDHEFLLGPEDWLFAHDVVIAHDKSVIKGDIMIDDNPKNLQGFDGERILFTQPWNRSYNKSDMYRANSWLSVLELL